ncbi:hypothetical protein H6F32_01375 [Anabaena sp. FACHB-1237]|uniref:beta strand repeat-containing protein n=1 Tax=Anabaena sp. FACHB-1237 TaxID=2692769 RepID=UPI001680A6FA|nr:hypothetical protein [Anabaena sp. FACHB-1237]MBD2136260.1 hypothetical protein [Anabaena sp. FACHB-1237]
MKTTIYRLAYKASLAFLLVSRITTSSQSVFAQLIPDNTLGTESSNISNNGLKDTVTGGATRGTNLFHSFEQFNVDVGKSVYFANPVNIENILTRVTGGNVSNIFGKLGVEGNANLFLINPNGIYFGNGASLDIKGSFTASTASGIKFADNTVFSATNSSQPPLLTISIPVGLQWGNNQNGNINNAGNLTTGKDLTLSGGNITIQEGTLQTGGNLTLASQEKVTINDSITKPVMIQSAGDVTIQGNQSVQINASNHSDSNITANRDIIFRSPVRLLSNANYTVGGYFTTEDLNQNVIDFLIPHNNVIKVNGDINLADYTGSSLYVLASGKVTLGNVTINNSDNKPITQIIADGNGGSQTVTMNSKNDVGILDVRGGIDVNKLPNILENSPTLPSGVMATFSNLTNADINSSNITNNGGNVLLTNQYKLNPQLPSANITVGNINSSNTGKNGGAIALNANNGNITTQNLNSFSYSFSSLGGNGGNIALNAKNITTTMLISASNNGNGGAININAVDNIKVGTIYSEAAGIGNGGNITLISNNGSIDTSDGVVTSQIINNSGGSGNGGSISFSAKNDITTGTLNSGAETGNSGSIQLNSTGGNININNILYSDSQQGNGGNIALNAKNITTTMLISASNNGNGGAININAVDNIKVGTIYSEAAGIGNGGNITLISNNGSIDTSDGVVTSQIINNSGGSGNGGSISFSAKNDITTGTLNSGAETGNSGSIQLNSTGGNININNILYSDSQQGNGGNIALNASNGNISTESLYSYSYSGNGNSGNIQFNSDNGTVVATNSSMDSSNYGGGIGKAGDVNIFAKSISFNNSSIDAYTLGQGNGGNIDIKTGSMSLGNGSYISSLSFGQGNGGNISVQATDGVLMSDYSYISTSLYDGQFNMIDGTRKAGDIYIKAKSLFIRNFSDLNSSVYSLGDAGQIKLEIDDSITLQNNSAILNYVYGTANGNGNNINIKARNLSLTNGSQIMAIAVGNGNAGNINIDTAESVNISGIALLEDVVGNRIQQGSSSGLFSSTRNMGRKGGNIAINTGIFQILDGGVLDTRTENGNPGGNITINANSVEVTNGGQFLANTSSSGQAGNITVNTTNLLVSGSDSTYNSRFSSIGNQLDPFGKKIVPNVSGTSGFFTNTSSLGNSGNINIAVNGNIFIENGGELSASTTAQGKAGNINLNTNNFKLENGGSIYAFTNGSGQGGTININANNSVHLGRGSQNLAPVISVETSGAGKAGDIMINTPNFNLSEAARITATATQNASNTDQGGSITLNISQMNLAGVLEIFAETKGKAPAGTLKLNPYSNQNTLNLNLYPGSIISGSTLGSGNGGDFQISAPETINITGKGKLAVESTGSGNAGNIFITTQNLNINDGVKISASTTGNGQGGNINISANNLTVNNGGQLLTTTSGNAKAGNIIIKVRDNITLDGINTGLFATTEKGSIGNGGSIDIDPEIFMIRNGAGIGVNSQGNGKGGNITLQAGTLILDNKAFITAETINNEGGEITLNINDLFWLRNNSNITATAGTAGAGGNGGNININVPFMISFASENNDITANAFKGNGGKINITTNTIFGLKFQPQQTDLSDITASSEFGLSGQVTINRLDVDPSKGLLALPSNFVDASSQLAQGCSSNSKVARQESRFNIIGKGGLPSHPDDLFTGNSPVVDLVDIQTTKTSQETIKSVVIDQNNQKVNLKNRVIQQAQGWIFTNDGKVILTAETPQATVQNSSLNNPGCEVFSQ